MIDQQGLLHVGDIIKEVNGKEVGNDPKVLQEMLKEASGSVVLKILPSYQEPHTARQVSWGRRQQPQITMLLIFWWWSHFGSGWSCFGYNWSSFCKAFLTSMHCPLWSIESSQSDAEELLTLWFTFWILKLSYYLGISVSDPFMRVATHSSNVCLFWSFTATPGG